MQRSQYEGRPRATDASTSVGMVSDQARSSSRSAVTLGVRGGSAVREA